MPIMNSIIGLPGVVHEPVFHYFEDDFRPARCELVIHPTLG